MKYLGLLIILVGCAPSAVQPTTKSPVENLSVAPTGAYGDFVEEFCNGWATKNRAIVPAFQEFIQRAQAQTPSAVSTFPLQVLQDRTLYPCWRTASEVIGYAGTSDDVVALVQTLEAIKPGQWSFTSSREVVRLTGQLGVARDGLGIAMGRLGPSSPGGQAAFEALQRSMQFSFWLTGDHLPLYLQTWTPELTADELKNDLAYIGVMRSMDSLAASGTTEASQYLTDYYAQAMSDPNWQLSIKLGKISRIEAAIVRTKKIQTIGLDAYINEMGGGY